MNKKFRLLALVLAVIVSFILYLKASEKTYSDQTIKTLSDKLQAHVVSFLKKNQIEADTLKQDFHSLNYQDLTQDFLNRYAFKRLQNSPEMQGLIIFGDHFHFLFLKCAIP